MSNIELIIEERAADIGKFMVGRLLPFRQKRMVGPFIYIDHMGPVKLSEEENFDVLPHPHIGLSTLTFLFEGSIYYAPRYAWQCSRDISRCCELDDSRKRHCSF